MKLLNDFKNMFKSESDLQTLLALVENDRVLQTNTAYQFLKAQFQPFLLDPSLVQNGRVSEQLIIENPLLFILLTQLVEYENPLAFDSTTQRVASAEAYKSKYCTKLDAADIIDDRFELHYFYSHSLIPVLLHVLLLTHIHPYHAKYDSEMMGFYAGNKKFRVGDIVTKDMLEFISKQESLSNKSFPAPVKDSVEQREDGLFVTKKEVTTATLYPSLESHLDELYTPFRRQKQQEMLARYQSNVANTSQAAESVMVNPNEKSALIVIGPYGCGKTTFCENTFGLSEDKGLLVSLSVDALHASIQRDCSFRASRSDFHFEACILKKVIDDKQYKCLFATGAYVDEARFDDMLNKLFKGRTLKIVEIATPTPHEATQRMLKREGITDKTRTTFLQALNTSNDAQKFRKKRIELVLAFAARNPATTYELMCNTHDERGGRSFIPVCKVQNGELIIKNETLFTQLMDPTRLASADQIELGVSFTNSGYGLYKANNTNSNALGSEVDTCPVHKPNK